MNWYYALNGQQSGPVSEQQLMQLAAAGTIQAGTLIWRDGMADWQPLSVAMPAALAGGTLTADAPQIGGVAVPLAQKDIVVQQMREGVQPMVAGAVEYAGFWIRFVAKFIDGLILLVPNMTVQFLLTGAIGGFGTQSNPGDAAAVGAALASMAFSITTNVLYNSILVSKYGATWGKMAVGLKVINDDGSAVQTGKAVGRVFAEIVSGLTCYIGYIIAGFDEQKRALHDHMCSTRVIKVK